MAEYNSEGVLLGLIWLGTSGSDLVTGLALGPDGAAYVTGSTNGSFSNFNAGSYDVFVAKIVPEPSAALLLAGAAFPLLLRRRS